jgi:hypothetical protein
MLPQQKPRATGLLLIMPPIRSREVACAQRSRVGHREDVLQAARFQQCSVQRPFRPNIQHERGNRQTERQRHVVTARASRVQRSQRFLTSSGTFCSPMLVHA